MPKPQSAAVHQTTGPRRVPHTAPPRHFDPPPRTPPGGHLSIAHPPRCRPAIVLIRALHPQVARPSAPVHRTRRPGALSAAEDFLASHFFVGMTLDRLGRSGRYASGSIEVCEPVSERIRQAIHRRRPPRVDRVVPDVPNQRCICAGPYQRRPSRKAGDPLGAFTSCPRLPCSTPTIVIITNLVPAKARRKHSHNRRHAVTSPACPPWSAYFSREGVGRV
jgi:hypothetical protein